MARGSAFLSQVAVWLLKYKIPIIVIIVLLSSFCAYYYNKIPRDPSVEAMVLDGDPDLEAYKHFKKIFGNDEMLLMATKVDDIFNKEMIKDVNLLCEELEKIPFIKEATSFSNTRSVRGENDAIIVEQLIPEVPETNEEMALIKKRVLSEKDYVGNLFSADGTTMTVVAKLEYLTKEQDSTETRTTITHSARKLAATAPFDKYEWHVAGVPALKTDLAETQKKESLKFQLMIFLMLTFVLFIIFRTIGGVFVTLATIQASILMLMAAHYFSGIPLTMVSTILTPLMLIYGVSSSVHIQTHYALKTKEGMLKRKAITAAIVATMVPCLFNSVTTSVGFGSNLVSAIKPIREFAIFSSGGIMLSFFLSFLIVPTILIFFKAPGKSAQKAHESGLRVYFLNGIVNLIQKRRNWVLVVSVILLAISIYGMSQIRVETKLLEYFRPESPIRTAYTFIEDNLSGVSSMEIMVDSGKQGGLKDPEIIAKVAELSDYITEKEQHMTSALSIVNMYKRINMALHGDDESWRKIPTSRNEAAQLILLYSMSGPESDLHNFVSSDYRYGRISTRLHALSSSELQELVSRVKTKTASIFDSLKKDNVKVNVTGSAVLYANMNGSLVKGQIETFLLSLLLISIMMVLVAGEVGLGLVSLLPNLMPIAITMGFMGFAGFPLDSTTAMVAPVALGMAVDSTIHFMVRFRREYLRVGDYNEAMGETIHTIGRAMLGTSIPLTFGFLVLTLSEFLPVFVFGLLSGLVVCLAMVFDLVLTPICMVMYKPKYKKTGLIDFFE